MDDPGWSWPAWKFGLKRDDLFSSLHDQYNTFTFTLQDPEAFHADVYEISHDASTTDEFHKLLAERRQQRLRELHDSLETLAVEIIANPKLMDSPQWEHALQLFRTKSFDSLVRYFATYLPEGYLDSRPSSPATSFSDAESVRTTSTKTSSVDDAPVSHSSFPHCPVITEEPCALDTENYSKPGVNVPLSPPASEAAMSEAFDASPTDDLESRAHSTNPPSRSMSFSGSESDAFSTHFRRPILHDDDDASQPDSLDTAVTSVSDSAERRSTFDSVDGKDLDFATVDEDEDDDLLTAQFPEDAFDLIDGVHDTEDTLSIVESAESDTPTPRQEGVVDSYVEYKSVLCRRHPSPYRRRSPSPKSHRDAAESPHEIRRSPDEASSKIQKPTSDPIRRRPKGRI
jgi:hypothetical protein